MQQILEVDELYVDDNGDVDVSTQVAGYTVRVCPSCPSPHIEVYSVLVRDIEADPGLYEALNDLNRGLAHARAFWTSRRVILAGELLGSSADEDSLRCLCNEIAAVGDEHAPRLAEVFGGTLREESE